MLGILNPKEDHAPIALPSEAGKIVQDLARKVKAVYIHGEAESKAGFDIPVFIDGNLSQLEKPIDEQEIIMILPDGEHLCKAEYYDEPGSSDCYLITLKTEPSVHSQKNG